MSKKSTSITLDEWIDATFKRPETKPENSFTIKEACVKTGNNRRTMQTKLDTMIEDGKLVKGKCFEDGRVVNYYLPIEFTKKK